MLRFILAFFLLLSTQGLVAQELHSKNRKAKESFRKAEELVQIGNLYDAEQLLLGAVKRDKGFDEAILLLHDIYLRRDQADKARAVFTNYQAGLDLAFENRILSDQANHLYERGDYSDAKKSLSAISGQVYGIPESVIARLQESIDFALQQLQNPIEIDFETLSSPLNEFGQQYFPSITFDRELVFTVRENNGRGNENIYTSSFMDGDWSKPESISGLINSDRNEGTASISADGSTLVFTACNLPENIGSCDLYISYKEKNEWTEPELLSEAVNSKSWDSQPSLSRDGSKLYFVSRRPGGLGRQDIWLTTKSNDGWSKAVNLGPKINTKYDDCSPYIYADNQTLFFASKGRIGLGGYDLFVAKNEADNWEKPKNLGYPVNNAFDQVGYSISVNGWAYFSSSNGQGEIILKRFRVPKDVFEIETINLFVGRVLDSISRAPVNAKLKFIDFDSQDTSQINTDKNTGRFEVYFGNENPIISVTSDGYLGRLLSVQVLANLNVNEVLLKPINKEEKVDFGVINFDFASAEIKPDSYAVLNGVLEFLNLNPNLVIEIGGHTDAIGEGVDNLALSEARAKSVYQFLLKKGVTKENLVFKGYGEERPLNLGNTETERNQNRRIEFRIIRLLK